MKQGTELLQAESIPEAEPSRNVKPSILKFPQPRTKLSIDIDFYTKVTLEIQEKQFECYCTTGQILAWTELDCGMPGVEGAIDAVGIDPITLEPSFRVIGENNTPPRGITSAGMVDAVAQMVLAGILTPEGAFSEYALSERIRTGADKQREYFLCRSPGGPDIRVTQGDIQLIQMAKASLYAGAKTLMNHCGVTAVDEIILSGSLGCLLNRENAFALGMFPDCSLNSIHEKYSIIDEGDSKDTSSVTQVKTNDPVYEPLFTKAAVFPHETDSFSRNHPFRWHCTGNDMRKYENEALLIGQGAFESTEAMDRAVMANRGERPFLTYPFMQKLEAAAFGGIPSFSNHGGIFPDYIYQTVEDIPLNRSLLESPAIQYTLDSIKKHAQEPVVLEVCGPFSVLASLINPIKLYACGKKNKELLRELQNSMVNALTEYTIEAIKCGVDIISFSDVEGITELVGKNFYNEQSGAAAIAYIKKIEPHLDTAIVHICGKTSHCLQNAGFVSVKTFRVEENKSYLDILFTHAREKQFRFMGHCCIHTAKLRPPIVTLLQPV
jgi:hypothetical protein